MSDGKNTTSNRSRGSQEHLQYNPWHPWCHGGWHENWWQERLQDNSWDQWPAPDWSDWTQGQATAAVAGAGNAAAVAGAGNAAAGNAAAVAGASNAAAFAGVGNGAGVPGVGDGAAVAGAASSTESSTERFTESLSADRNFDLEYFRRESEILTRAGTWTDTYKQHNVALKYFRDSAEKEGLDVVNFSNTDPDPVAQIVHDRGMSYHFVGEPRIPWRWQEMVAQMTDDSMRLAVQGLGGQTGRSRGIVSCRLQRFLRYDQKRNFAERHPELGNPRGKGKHATQSMPPPRAKELLVTWDFVLVCDDGTQVCLHPNLGNPKIACYTGEGVQDHEIPNTGKGGSSGKGTYKYFKNKHIQATLKFDPKKRPS